ncbi:MAG: signal recognition particle-docking protein FtsY [Clostridia bacterium]|nr:signal recognition particle-docking protein FtsY [Clostridia bacterium]
MSEKPGRFQKFLKGLSRTRGGLIGQVFGVQGLDEDFFETLEEAMILADMGVPATERLLAALRARCREERLGGAAAARDALAGLIAGALAPAQAFAPEAGPAALLIVGVNGVGKTTSAGKLAHMYKAAGRRPMLAAADTFRAAAAEQLAVWAERAGVPLVRHGEGADPAAVVFDAAASCRAKGCDLLICDTAGRLHNKSNLMNELAKIRRVLSRELPDTPVETLLVLDAVTGQNAVEQARSFLDCCEATGVILTKLDGTAKGGVVVAVAAELGLPVRFVGVGEGPDDLEPFDAVLFARALLA